MSCCGQKRQQWQKETIAWKSVPVSMEPVLENPVVIHYHGSSSYMVKGPNTGYLYLFAASEAGLSVDGRDAPLLLAVSRKFSLAK